MAGTNEEEIYNKQFLIERQGELKKRLEQLYRDADLTSEAIRKTEMELQAVNGVLDFLQEYFSGKKGGKHD